MNTLNIPSGKDILNLSKKSPIIKASILALLLALTPGCASKNVSKPNTDFVPNDTIQQPSKVKKPSLLEIMKAKKHERLNKANFKKLNDILTAKNGFKIKDNDIYRFGVKLCKIPIYNADMQLTGVQDGNNILITGDKVDVLQFIENLIYETINRQNSVPNSKASSQVMKAECPEIDKINYKSDIIEKTEGPVQQAIQASNIPLEMVGKPELEAIAVVESNSGEHPNLMGIMNGTQKALENIIKKDPELKQQAENLGPKDRKNDAYNAFLSKLRLQIAEQKAKELTETDIQKIRMYALNNWKSLRDTARLTLVNKGMEFDAGAFNEFVQAIVDGDRDKIAKYFVLKDYNGSDRQHKYAATVLFLAEKVISKS